MVPIKMAGFTKTHFYKMKTMFNSNRRTSTKVTLILQLIIIKIATNLLPCTEIAIGTTPKMHFRATFQNKSSGRLAKV